MVTAEQVVALGVALAVAGAASVLLDAVHADTERRFVAYLVGLLLGLAGLGLVLSVTL